jgi:TPR repeat protein
MATVEIVEKPFFRRLFSFAAPLPVQETTRAMAERGVADAQFSLGLIYANGKGAPPDYAQAELWYLKAAAQNHALAQFNLGIMHANGQGVPRDRDKSLMWIQKAADLGDAGAQYRLGLSHQRDIRDGLPENATESRLSAYKWFRLAADQGYHGAETACELVNLNMSREDVVEGGRRVAAFNQISALQNQ